MTSLAQPVRCIRCNKVIPRDDPQYQCSNRRCRYRRAPLCAECTYIGPVARDLTTKVPGEWRLILAISIISAAIAGYGVGRRDGLSAGLGWFLLFALLCFVLGITRAAARLRIDSKEGVFDETKRLPVDASDVPPYAACVACRCPVELTDPSDIARAKAAARLAAFSEARDKDMTG